MLFSHLVQFIHATLVEVNVLLNVNFVSVHYASKAVRHLIGQVLFLGLILLPHELLVKQIILLIKMHASVVNLRKIWFVWLLVGADVTRQWISDSHQVFMSNLLKSNYNTNDIVIFNDEPFKILSNQSNLSVLLTSASESFKILLVRSELSFKHDVAHVSQTVWVLMELILGVFLISHFFSQLAINIVTIFNAFILVRFQLLCSVLKLLNLKFIWLNSNVQNISLQFESFNFFFLTNDFSFEIWSFIDKAF